MVFVGAEKTQVSSLENLGTFERIALGTPQSVPAGQYAKQAMETAGIYRTLEQASKLVMAKDDKKCGVFGPSGSGKSTLMHMIAGLLKPDKGRIVLNGLTLFDHKKRLNLPPERRRIGVVFQHTHRCSLSAYASISAHERQETSRGNECPEHAALCCTQHL